MCILSKIRSSTLNMYPKGFPAIIPTLRLRQPYIGFQVDKNGLTALHYAAGRGDLGIVVALLELQSRALRSYVYA